MLCLAACSGQSHPPTPPPEPVGVDVGYGPQPKDRVTGAVTSLSEQELGNRPLRIEEFLRGKVAGLQIIQTGMSVRFRIRGTSSIQRDPKNASRETEQDALVVVDGVMISNEALNSALAGLVPGDIKQVSVLKDVASTSIYGFRGAGGVILITTKR